MTQRLPKQRQIKPIWQHTAALLLQAHESGKRLDLQHATAQLRRAHSMRKAGRDVYPSLNWPQQPHGRFRFPI